MKGWRLLHRGSDAFWVGAVPTAWPRVAWWTDISSGVVVDTARGGSLSERRAPEEVLYVPPVPGDAEQPRRRQVARWARQGARTVVHVGAEAEPWDASRVAPSILLWDLTSAVLRNAVGDLPHPPAGSWVLWPLIRGVTDDAGEVEAMVRASAAAGVAGIVPIAPELTPRTRRLVVDQYGREVFEALHHGDRAQIAPVAAAIVAAGMEFQPPRPARTGESAAHTRACEVLGWLGDLYLRLQREERGQQILRAQRWLESSPWDLETIARDGHLELVPELSGEAGEVVRELLESGRSARLEAARSAYLGQGAEAGDE